MVRVKKEIITFRVNGINPSEKTSPKISPQELKQWLDEGKPVTLLDTRNDYEVQLGTFKGARDLNISHFGDFPQAIKALPEDLKEQPLVMFCTGGIRCEKAGPFLEQAGFQKVWQLDGGILRYFDECGGDHYQGECFVFDQRVSLDPQLKESQLKECFVCRALLTVEEQQSDKYVMGKSCPRCYQEPQVKMKDLIEMRNQQIREATTPLPGSIAYDNQRPLNVPLRFDRFTLLDFLDGFHPHLGRETWQNYCVQGRIVFDGKPAAADKVVRSGERYCHLHPATVEPQVNADIRILYEDHWIVAVHKPAPLPMHPCGRFNRNTLMYLLNQIYHPQKLRVNHRLDANTSGVVVFSRNKAIASQVQPQFENRQVRKMYYARSQGHPPKYEFNCETRISETTTIVGARLPDPEGMEARTKFRVQKRFVDGTALVEAHPITGRTNQIRLHLWDLGFPICGDPVYLPDKQLGNRQTLDPGEKPLCLHAYRLALVHPDSKEEILLEAEVPEWANRS